MGRGGSLVLVDSPPRDGVSIKTPVVVTPITTNLIVSAMNQNRNINNDVNGTGNSSEGTSSGRCSVDEQRRPGRNQATARIKWTKEMNIVVMECFFSADPFDGNGVPIRGYRQRMFREWRERGMFHISEQRLCDQARAIRQNGWLSAVELEAIRRKLVNQSEGELQEVNDINDGEDILSRLNIEVEMNEVNEADISIEVGEAAEITPEEQLIIDEEKALMAQGETNNNIMFKIVDQKRLSEETLKVNGAIKHHVTADITQTNNLIKAASPCQTARIEICQEGEETGPMVEATYRRRHKEPEEKHQHT